MDNQLQVTHLDEAWKSLRKQATARGLPLSQLSDSGFLTEGSDSRAFSASIQKKAQQYQVSSPGVSVNRLPPAAFSPFLSNLTLSLPTDLRSLNALRRFYYIHDPYVRTALTLHATYPISDFRIRCPNNEPIQEEYEQIKEDLDVKQLLIWIGLEYNIVGEAIPFGHWNKDELSWDSFVLLNPDYVDIIHPILGEGNSPGHRPEIYLSRYSKEMKGIVQRGPNDPKTGRLYRHLAQTVPDLVDKIKKNQPFRLADMCTSHIANRMYFSARGASLIDSILRVLMYEERILEAQIRGAERYQNPIEFWTLGSDEIPADAAAYDAFQEALAQSWVSPVKAIVWNHMAKCEMIGAAGAMLPLGPEFEHIAEYKMTGLQVDASLLHGEGPTYANASVASDYRMGLYQVYRNRLEQWMLYHFFEPIAKARGYYQVSKRELQGNYRVKSAKRRPILPELVWERGLKTDVFGTLNTLIPLAQEGKVPWGRVYDLLDFDSDDIKKELVREAKQFAYITTVQAQANQAASIASGALSGGLSGGGLPPALGGGGGMGTEPSPGEFEGAGETLMGGGSGELTQPEIQPPESSLPAPSEISTNGNAPPATPH